MESWRFGATMFVAFGGLALVLAGVGLYGVVAYGVSQRRPELGIRLALGARPTDLVQLVVSGGVRLVLVGVGAGIVLALATARWIAPLLFHESATDPAVYAAVASVLLVVAIVATAAPATAAAHVDPNVALRAD
jgi:ABC-type antimicrobial peptide transport system permease subunit